MAPNLIDAELYRLIRDLADQAGESMTTAVTIAVQERSDKLKQEDAQRRRIEEMQRIAHEAAPLLKDGPRYSDVDDLLYDEWGLPR